MSSQIGSRRATIVDVARRAQVSTTTVSRVLSQTAQVSQATVARVLTAVDELSYRPHLAARSLASRHTRTLGLVLPRISSDFIAPLLSGIESTARGEGYTLLVSAIDPRQRPALPVPLGEHNSDGLLVFTHSLADAELSRLSQLKFPLVLLHRSPPPGAHIPSVTFENKAGARQVMQHLLQVHHCRRVAFLRGEAGAEDSYWREVGYRQTLAAHGIAPETALVGEGGFDRETAFRQVQQWLRTGETFDAIFAGDDASALGAVLALQQAGRRVPEDVAVVGFDDVPLSRYLAPSLTTVRVPIEAAGSQAVRLLIRLINNQSVEPLVLLPSELVIRRSCGCPPEVAPNGRA